MKGESRLALFPDRMKLESIVEFQGHADCPRSSVAAEIFFWVSNDEPQSETSSIEFVSNSVVRQAIVCECKLEKLICHDGPSCNTVRAGGAVLECF